ncbi:RarD protein, DMT superfamily transporter [Nitratireductor aquibiodomus RA22]|uniref:RarD protein, DMT superfamily transporter n=1 Tax=Nitratireductor aquibiodomus RA22 TaxID=1189611 RepID=I5C3G7_9HYPH|nr:RarD protein, DMT superfamily transporter [Nitratireductor aquibiodomus RA22]
MLAGMRLISPSNPRRSALGDRLSLAFSFAAYGILRKTLPIGPSQGFFLEVLILALPALGYLIWLGASGEAHFTLSNPADIALLIGCGPVTAIPLILFAMGAKRLRYSTIGIMQYTAPTMIFLIAVFVFKEPFGGGKAVAFAFIWAALPFIAGRCCATRAGQKIAAPEGAANETRDAGKGCGGHRRVRDGVRGTCEAGER